MIRLPYALRAQHAVGARAAVAATLLSSALATTQAVAQDGCERPDRPEVPDGASATMEEMLAGQEAVRSFQSTNMDYMKCLERSFNAAKAMAASAADEEERERASGEYEAAVEAYNAAVSAEEEVAGAFNIELREYKAANQ
jgi:hypothetical protein